MVSGEDGELAEFGVSQAAVDADQVSKVEQFDETPTLVADVLSADENLDPLGSSRGESRK